MYCSRESKNVQVQGTEIVICDEKQEKYHPETWCLFPLSETVEYTAANQYPKRKTKGCLSLWRKWSNWFEKFNWKFWLKFRWKNIFWGGPKDRYIFSYNFSSNLLFLNSELKIFKGLYLSFGNQFIWWRVFGKILF